MAPPRSVEALAALIAVNITPLAGILLLGWLPEAVLVSYFVDTYLGMLAVLVLVMIHVTGDEGGKPIRGFASWTKAVFGLALVGAILAALVGFPLLFVLGDGPGAWSMFDDRGFLAALAVQCVMSLYATLRVHRDLATRSDDDRVLAGRLFLLAARWIAVFVATMIPVTHLLGPKIASFVLIAIYAGASIYFELHPEAAMRFVRGKDAKPIVFDGDLDGKLAASAKGARRPANPSDTVQPQDRRD